MFEITLHTEMTTFSALVMAVTLGHLLPATRLGPWEQQNQGFSNSQGNAKRKTAIPNLKLGRDQEKSVVMDTRSWTTAQVT